MLIPRTLPCPPRTLLHYRWSTKECLKEWHSSGDSPPEAPSLNHFQSTVSTCSWHMGACCMLTAFRRDFITKWAGLLLIKSLERIQCLHLSNCMLECSNRWQQHSVPCSDAHSHAKVKEVQGRWLVSGYQCCRSKRRQLYDIFYQYELPIKRYGTTCFFFFSVCHYYMSIGT